MKQADKQAPPTQQVPEKAKAEPAPEPKYTIVELAANAQRLFSCHEDIAKAALSIGGKPEYSITEAASIIKRFQERKVI